ncbi:YcnI family protein [Pedococcus sp.]|jgi:uncharacterized protein YcnI|uniref:YcnI family copper-binding membrane protein n=1 Tax=Pedococcus sp. TaxID=2860345 RepID=UPI002E1582C4|nr:YcnI family protein [Pedococcus sp.]
MSAIPRRVITSLSGTAVALVLAATAASAHVHVIPDTTASGADAQLTFRVPSEEPVARTTRVVLTLPQDRPLPSVAVKPLPGWTVSVTEGPLPKPMTVDGTTLTKAPRTITWTASAAAALGPDQYQDFSLAVAPLPSPGELVFPVTQTYSDGTVVQWNQPSPAGKPEPEHPAPAFVVTAAAADATPAQATSAVRASGVADPVARWLAGASLVLAVLGLGAVALGRRRTAGRGA